MYVGTEYEGVTSPDFDEAMQAIDNLIVDVQDSDPAGRMEAIARQIAATKPHLVSLQEVATWSTGPTKENLTVQFDFLQLLMDALDAKGLNYASVGSLTYWDFAVATSSGFLRNAWSVVLLARSDLNSLSFTNVQGATWETVLYIPLPALDDHPDLCPGVILDNACYLPFPRGWVSADTDYRGKTFRIIAAHLDSFVPDYEIAQGLELLSGPANTSLPVIVAGDLNTDCSNPDDPTHETCTNFDDAGFIDAWEAANPSEPGFTKALFPLNDPNAILNGRSDYIMIRGRFDVKAAVIVGEELADRTESGLWASDHAGVVARLHLPAKNK